MCGITAAIALEGIRKSQLDPSYRQSLEQELSWSLDKISHRGPDSQDIWISEDNRVGFASARLAINDLTVTGRQPFSNESGSIHAIVNGEFYFSDEDRTELEAFHQFRGHCDCEIVIPLYLKYGVRFLSKLRGEFALCLYDARQKSLILARDPYGIKPLFWTIVDGRLLVSSEAKAFLPLGWQPEWDVNSLREDGWMHDERTIFRGVQKLRPGYYMTCSSFGYMERRQYWEMNFPDKNIPDIRSETEMIARVREGIKEAVRIRLRADVPVGIYLSGGIDSASICGVTASMIEEECARTGQDVQEAKSRIKCFCIGFDANTTFDETEIARGVAAAAGFEFIPQRMDDELFAAGFEDATYKSELYIFDLNYIAKYQLSHLARENQFKVVLTGEGADELFAGYPHFAPDLFREEDRTWGSVHLDPAVRAKRTAELDLLINKGWFRGSTKKTEGASGEHIVADELKVIQTNPAEELGRRVMNDCHMVSHLPDVTLLQFAPWTQCYGNRHAAESRVTNPSVWLLESINDKWHPLHTAQFLWTRSMFSNILLTCLGDRTEMSHSVEGRPAYLDRELAQYVNGLPPTTKLKYDPETDTLTEKWILREAMKPYLPEDVYKRKKHPFSAPPQVPLGGKMHQLLLRLVTPENVDQLGFLEWEYVEGFLSKSFGPDFEIKSLRCIFMVAQFVVLSQRFGIRKAEPLI